MALTFDRVVLIVGLTSIVIVAVIAVRVLMGRRWRNSISPADKPAEPKA